MMSFTLYLAWMHNLHIKWTNLFKLSDHFILSLCQCKILILHFIGLKCKYFSVEFIRVKTEFNTSTGQFQLMLVSRHGYMNS